jgi:tetratricopeptide (TPR) repeat protein
MSSDASGLLDRLADSLAQHRAGRADLAEAGYRAVLAVDPDQPIALHLLGVLTLAAGRPAEALALLRQALDLRPNNRETRLALADACAATGDRAQAIARYRDLLADDPGHAGALVNLANVLRDSGDAEGAIAACHAALATEPGLVQAHSTLGSAFLLAGQAELACDAYRAATALAPDFAPGWVGLGMALMHRGLADEALEMATRGAALAPGLAEARFVQGLAYAALDQPGVAVAALTNCLRLSPDHARAHLALGNALIDLDSISKGEAHLRRAAALDPALPEAHASLGFLLSATGQLPEAIAACDAAIALRPNFARAHWNKSVAQLLAGDFAGGWENYEWRKRHDRFARDFFTLPGREWQGETLEGHTLLVHAEQGLGDTIQFARYLPLLAARGARVVLACASPLIPLLAGMPGVAGVVPKDAALPSYDFWVDQMSLPRLFGTGLESIPTPDGYLQADPTCIAAWGPRHPRPRIGIVWSGNPAHHNDRRRSLPTAALAPLIAVPEVTWISLQKGPRSLEITLQHGVADLSRRLTDFADTAALIATLDLVIAVDTSVAHLAGALGRPVWVMLPHAPDWRWMTERRDSPWYSSMVLFRQDRPGDWDGVIAQVAAALPAFLAAHAGPCGVRSARAAPLPPATDEPDDRTPSPAFRLLARA